MNWVDLALSLHEVPKEKDVKFDNLKVYLDTLMPAFLSKVKDLDESMVKELKKRKNDPNISSKADLIQELEKEIRNFNGLLKSATPYSSKVEAQIKDYFFNADGSCTHKNDFVFELDSSHNMYRMRNPDRYTNFKSKEMYLFSSDLYNLAGAARYNHSGQACLYTADSLYTAWEELRRPDFHKVNFVRYNTTRKVSVLDLTIPQKPNSLFMLMRAYICLVASAKVEDKDKHHWQYIFPQLLIKVVSEMRRDGGSDVVGIRYLSSRRYECEDFNIDNSSISSAYVFPSKEVGDKGYCESLAKMFQMTESLSYFFLKLHRQKFIPLDEPLTSEYQNTIFYELEEILKAQHQKSCFDIISGV